MLRPDMLASEYWIEASKSFEAELRGGARLKIGGGEKPLPRPAGRADVPRRGTQDGLHACLINGGGDG